MKKDLPAELNAKCDTDPDLFAVVAGILWITAVRVAEGKDAEIYELIKDVKVDDVVPDFKAACERYKEKNAERLSSGSNLSSV
ncbi:hypothetical protein LZD49_28540 [Dyadobacter sp. CY261]|uniref:hypothetical protein n=1 Tax=Dyadobacter sp. CY261 TaxID=2907203 RepID=UPI001F3B8FC3|nr:hypothetical protein [Dyadobacter sp. CY261]MCF0074467.1 hypothetical protein [Dyadobacter sp. CY261]